MRECLPLGAGWCPRLLAGGFFAIDKDSLANVGGRMVRTHLVGSLTTTRATVNFAVVDVTSSVLSMAAMVEMGKEKVRVLDAPCRR